MSWLEILNEINKYKPLDETLNKAKNVGRHLLNSYFSEIPYTKDCLIKKELNFFYEDIKFLSKKWILAIIWELETYKGSNFNELKRIIRGISSRILSDRLKELKKNGIISRKVQNTHPPTVLYQLTDKGKGFVELMTVFIMFLKKYLKMI